MRNFLRLLARCFVYTVASPFLFAEWCYHQTTGYAADNAYALESDDTSAKAEEMAAYRAWVAENCAAAEEIKVSRERDAATKARLDRAIIAFARARLHGETIHPDDVVAFFEKHGAIETEDTRPTAH